MLGRHGSGIYRSNIGSIGSLIFVGLVTTFTFFSTGREYGISSVKSVLEGDLNEDGIEDRVVVLGNGEHHIYIGEEDGGYRKLGGLMDSAEEESIRVRAKELAAQTP